METLQSQQLPDRDFAVVAGGLYTHRQFTRPESAWGLGEGGYVTEVQYPDPAVMEASDSALGFSIAVGAGTMLGNVEVVPTSEQGQ